MKWLKSTTDKAWTVTVKNEQRIIPTGNKWLQLDDSEYKELAQRPVIKSLIQAESIFVSEVKPSDLDDSVPELRHDKAQLQGEVDGLKAQLAQVEADKKAAAEQAEADKQAALKELDEKASSIISAKDDEIKELKKQLKEAKKG